MDAIEATAGDRAPDKRWVRKAGLAVGALTLLYMMALALLLILANVKLSNDARIILIFVLAVGLALAFSFIGGHAAASGTIPLVARHPLKFTTGGGVAVFLIVFFTAKVAWTGEPKTTKPPDRTRTETLVIALKAKIVKWRGDFENADGDSGAPRPGSEAILARVRDDSEHVATEMLGIDESHMDAGHVITKWQYGAYGLGLAASLEESAPARLELARRTRTAAEHALELVAKAQALPPTGDRYTRRLARFLVEDQAEGRLRYLIAQGMAIELLTPGGSVRPAQVREAIHRIPARFRQESPPEWNKWFRDAEAMARNESLSP
jgi:hypothetical protein